jgi:hypothetical protein
MGALIRTFAKRLGGERPSPFRAIGAAIISGLGVAVAVYRVLRH